MTPAQEAWSALQDLWDEHDMQYSESYWLLHNILKEMLENE